MLDLSPTTGKFYKHDYKILKNSQGLYKIKINDGCRWRFITDVDTMDICISSHVSSDQIFSRDMLYDFINKQILTPPREKLMDIDYRPNIIDDFEEEEQEYNSATGYFGDDD